jgi:hypothetical protein
MPTFRPPDVMAKYVTERAYIARAKPSEEEASGSLNAGSRL